MTNEKALVCMYKIDQLSLIAEYPNTLICNKIEVTLKKFMAHR